MAELHPTQQKLIELLKSTQDAPMTVRELQEVLGVSSTSTVHHHIIQLEKKGYLRRNPNNPNDYQILAESPDQEIAYLNVYGMAQCGPNGQILSGSPIDRVPVATKLLGFPSADAFLIKAKGNSMHPKIKDGDIVIARKSHNAPNGVIVVCSHQGEAKIKRFQADRGNIVLISENPEFAPIFAQPDELRVEGIVRGVINYTEIL
jgi:repressor LexA